MTRRVAIIGALLSGVALLAAGVAHAATDYVAGRDTHAASAQAKLSPARVEPHSGLVLTASDIAAIRRGIARQEQPVSGAFARFMRDSVPRLMRGTPTVYQGPYTGRDLGVMRKVFNMHWRDGRRARDLAIAYALTADKKYAAKSRQYLLAWANGSTPTDYAACPMPDTGQLQSYGFFSFAYAYDLTFDSGVYSRADRKAVTAYLRAGTDALQSCDQFDVERAKTRAPGALDTTYDWDSGLRYSRYDDFIGGDFAVLVQAASLACAQVSGYHTVVQRILYDDTFLFNLDHMLAHALTPANEGDGVAGHPDPVPVLYIFADPVPGRGGAMDYMTYNVRVLHVMVDMAQNIGWDPSRVAAARAKLERSWAYLGHFFGPNAEPLPNPNDVINYEACLPRFALPYRSFGDRHYLDILMSGDYAGHYEPQLIGPVTVTHSTR